MIIEKTHSSERPKQYWFEKLNNGKVDIYFTDDIKQEDDGFSFFLYKTTTKETFDFENRLKNNLNGFKSVAITDTKTPIINKKIKNLKEELSKTDYKALKFIEGFITEEDYQETKEYRNSLRLQINELEEIL